MALKDWSPSRILSIWTGWMSGLLVLLVGAVVATPAGISLSVSPGGLSLGVRILLGLTGLVAACLPPAVLTYAWYTARLRAWSEGATTRIDTPLEQRLRADVAHARELAEGPIHEAVPRPVPPKSVHRREDA